MIRTIQFLSRFNFVIDETTLHFIKHSSHLIKEISGERILTEFDKILYKKGSTKVVLELIEKSNLDIAPFGKKISNNIFCHLDNLDAVSFYYVLGTLGGVNPANFYRDRLKDEAPMVKALNTIDTYILSKFDKNIEEKDLRWRVFTMIKSSSLDIDSKILPERVGGVVELMKTRKIPMRMEDIPVNGDDIVNLFSIAGANVGSIIRIMHQDALMNKFDWKNRDKTLKYLERL